MSIAWPRRIYVWGFYPLPLYVALHLTRCYEPPDRCLVCQFIKVGFERWQLGRLFLRKKRK